jgi:hypothetical protein
MEGVEIAPLVPQLAAFPNKAAWRVRMRTTLLPLDSGDASLLRSRLKRLARPPDETRDAYLRLKPAPSAP